MKLMVDIKKALTAMLAVAAIAAPGAQADSWQLEQRGDSSDAVSRYLANQARSGNTGDALDRFLANDRRAPGGLAEAPAPDALERFVLNNPQGSSLRGYESFRGHGSGPVAVESPRGGIEWPTVGLGLLGALVVAASGAAGIAVLRTRGGRVAHS